MYMHIIEITSLLLSNQPNRFLNRALQELFILLEKTPVFDEIGTGK